MANPTTPFFVVGGTIPPGSPSYIERAADPVLFESLLAGVFCHVLTPRQMGKSSLMIRTAHRLRAADVAVARLDLTAVGQNLSPDQWYDGLLTLVGDQLNCEETLESWWRELSRLGPCQRFFSSLLRLLDQPAADAESGTKTILSGRSLVIFVDELDTVRSLPFSTDEFFAAIRECHNRRAENLAMRRLTFCLLGVATPADLIHDPHLTPFNVGQRIELHDFTREEMCGLAAGFFEGSQRSARAVLDRVYHWTHGHPYLTQRLCRALALDSAPSHGASRRPLSRRAVDRACHDLFLSPSARIQDDNLQLLRERLLNGSLNRARILSVYRTILRGWPPVPHDEADATGAALRLAGVARIERGRLRVRNRIYARAFDRTWVDASMPDVERILQRNAYRLGILRAAGVFVLILALLALLADHVREVQRRREQTVRLAITQGLSRMDRGDPIDALPHFLDALEGQHTGTPEVEVSRLRLGAVLERAPKIHRLFQLRAEASAVAVSTNTSRVATGDELGNVQLWDLDTGSRIGEQQSTRGRVADLRFDSAGELLIAFSDVDSARMVRSFRLSTEGLVPQWMATGIVSIAWSLDRLITASTAGILEARNPGTGAVLWRAQSRETVARLAASPGGLLAIGCEGGSVQLRDARSGSELDGPLPTAPTSHFQNLSVNPDGSAVAALYQSPVAMLWRRNASGWKAMSLVHSNWPFSAEFSPDGQRLVTGGADCAASLWDTTDGELRHRLPHSHDVFSASFSDDGARIVTACADGAVSVWSARSGEGPLSVVYHDTFALGASFVGTAQRIITHSRDRTACIWDLPPGFPLSPTKFGPSATHAPVYALAPLARLAAFLGDGNEVEIWSWEPPHRIAHASLPEGVIHLALSDDGRQLVAATANGNLWEWNPKLDRTPKPLATPIPPNAQGHPNQEFRGIALSPSDGRYLSAWMASGDFFVLDREGAAEPWSERFAVPPGGTLLACFSQDARWLAVGQSRGEIHVFDVASRKRVAHVILEDKANLHVTGIAFNPRDSGRVVASYSNGVLDPGGAALWHWREVVHGANPQWLGHKDGVVHMAISPDGSRIATASEDSSVRVWSGDSGLPENSPVRVQHQASFVDFSEENGLLLLGIWQGGKLARIFESATLEPISPVITFPESVLAAYFLPGPDWKMLTIPRTGQSSIVTLPYARGRAPELRTALRNLSPRFRSPVAP